MNNDGGPAFPVPNEEELLRGMSLRDYFAAAALTGLLADPNGPGLPDKLAQRAYAVAEAMLAEREAQ